MQTDVCEVLQGCKYFGLGYFSFLQHLHVQIWCRRSEFGIEMPRLGVEMSGYGVEMLGLGVELCGFGIEVSGFGMEISRFGAPPLPGWS